MKSKIILIAVTVIVLLILVCLLIAWYLPIIKGGEITQSQLESAINTMVRKNSTAQSSCKIIYKKDTEIYFDSSMNLDCRKKLDDMTDTEYIVELNFKDEPSYNDKYREIYAIFETFIYLKNKGMEKNPIAISCWYSSGQIDDTTHTFIIISMDELGKIYKSIVNEQMSDKNLVQRMAEFWVNKYHYNRRRLYIDEENSYRRNLLTPFNDYVQNNKQDFAFSYTKRYGFSIKRVSSMSTQEIFHADNINETGYLYGAWDDGNNIWLYGEDIGIRLYKFDGDKNWEQSDYMDENQIPYALKKVLETEK